jgi:hypothetical protein
MRVATDKTKMVCRFAVVKPDKNKTELYISPLSVDRDINSITGNIDLTVKMVRYQLYDLYQTFPKSKVVKKNGRKRLE